MDMYGLHTPDLFRIDDLLDFSNDDLFSTTDSNHHHHHLPPPENPSSSSAVVAGHREAPNPNSSTDFTDDLCVPSDDVAELEWLSKFVDDSFTDFPVNELAGTVNFRNDTSFHGRTRSKRSRAPSTNRIWTSLPESDTPVIGKSKTCSNNSNSTKKKESSSAASSSSSPSSSEARRCTHCASEKTPQWRTGPLGPKTLCNACGVRYKSGRLVPEYRPAASPTFVLTQHSNSHRKVMELRRQKEVQQQELYHRHHQDFEEVC